MIRRIAHRKILVVEDDPGISDVLEFALRDAGHTVRVVGLELGGDEYLTKPFSTRELLACIKAVTRRQAPQRYGNVLNSGTRTITIRDGVPMSGIAKPVFYSLKNGRADYQQVKRCQKIVGTTFSPRPSFQVSS